MRKRAITLILALLMCLSCALPASAKGGSRFTDVPDNAWYAEAVNAMADGGVLNGKGNGKFDPDAPVTLAELSTIYCRLMGREVKAEYGHWAGSAMRVTALGAEWTGYDDESYNIMPVTRDDYTEFPYADSPAYRADAFSLFTDWMYRWEFENYCIGMNNGIYTGYYDLADYIPSYSKFDKSKIPDCDEYEDACNVMDVHGDTYYIESGHYYWSKEIDYAYDLGLTHGVDKNYTCDAFGTLTRAQLAQMCYNMGWIETGSLAALKKTLFALPGMPGFWG